MKAMVGCAVLFFSFGVLSGWFVAKWNATKEQLFRCENCRWFIRGIDRAQEQWMEEEGFMNAELLQKVVDTAEQQSGPMPVRTWENRISMKDMAILGCVASEYGLEGTACKLLYAIYLVENGGPGREMGVLNEEAQRYKGDHEKSLRLQAQWAAGTIKKRFYGDLQAFADRWCPVGAMNDRKWNLNKNWLPNVQKILAEMNG